MSEKVLRIIVRFVFTILFVLLLVCTFLLSKKAGYLIFSDKAKNTSATRVQAVITVTDEESLVDIGRDLKEKGIVDNAWFFAMSLRTMEDYDQIQAGTYEVDSSMKPSAILKILIQDESLE